MKLNEALQNIGLANKEADVYIALLQLGKASAYSIAVKSGLKKPTTYVVLDELIKKDLIYKIPRAKKQQYMARSPEEAFHKAEEKLKNAKRKLPELLAITKGQSNKVNVIYYEGINGIKQLMEYRVKEMKGKEIIGFWATDKGVDESLIKYFKEEWQQLNSKNGIKLRGIVPNDDHLNEYRQSDQKYNRIMKVVPLEKYSSEVAIDTVGDIVRIQDYKNLQGIAIENADIAKTIREIFEMVWNHA